MHRRPRSADPVPYRPFWDRVGVAVTAVCAVHCLALPVLLPVLAASDLLVLAHHEFEWIVLGLAFVLAVVVLGHGYLHHHRRLQPLLLAGIGAVVCLFRHDVGHAWEPLVLLLGSGLMVAGHLLNLRWSRHFADHRAIAGAALAPASAVRS